MRQGNGAARRGGESIRTLSVSDLILDDSLQFRPLDRGTVKKYMSVLRAGVEMPPVKVASLNGALILTDGWHRVAALNSLDRREVSALVEPAESLVEVRWLAAKANTDHGLPLKAKEYRKVLKSYVRAKKHRRGTAFKSYREIATELGGAKGYTTIRNWMRQDFPSVFRAMSGADEPKNATEDHPVVIEPTLEMIAEGHLHDARLAMKGVTDPYDRGDLVVLLEEILAEAKSVSWLPPAERPEEPTDF
jgi:hypothetical protein